MAMPDIGTIGSAYLLPVFITIGGGIVVVCLERFAHFGLRTLLLIGIGFLVIAFIVLLVTILPSNSAQTQTQIPTKTEVNQFISDSMYTGIELQTTTQMLRQRFPSLPINVVDSNGSQFIIVTVLEYGVQKEYAVGVLGLFQAPTSYTIKYSIPFT